MPNTSEKRSDLAIIPAFQQRYLVSVQSAAQNFEQSSEERGALVKAIKEDVYTVESQERIALRETLIQPNDALGLERILGSNDLMPINYLSRGLKVGRSVCRIHVHRPNGRPDSYGTGFMISPTLLLTNNHVLPDAEFAQRSQIEFDYEYDENFQLQGSHFFALKPDRFFYTNAALDFTLVAVSPISRTGKPLGEFGFLELIEESGKALIDEKVSLIQHPRGTYKQVAIRENRVLNYFEDFIHYQTDTEPGSSGSPVFNDQWDVVALHNAGIPKRNSNGKILKRDGRIYQAGDPEDSIDWIANQGIRISSIFKHLKNKRDWRPSELSVLEEFGAFSSSTLNQAIVELAHKDTFTSLPSKQNQPVPPVITLTELLEKLENPEISEADIAPYVILSEEDSSNMDPKFVLNPEFVLVDTPGLEETAQLLNLVNWIAKKSREMRYKDKKAKAKIRIVAEGDSWFQYPLILHDVIDHLMDEETFAVLCFSDAGDLLKEMVAKAEFHEALVKETPQFFLISGGGNDLVAGAGLTRLLKRPGASFQASDLINHVELASFKSQIVSDFTRLFSNVLTQAPNIKILCHGYSYPVPNRGPWLGRPMEAMGIGDRQVQQEVIRIIFDEINAAIRNVADSFPNSAFYLDVKGVVPAHGWYDELHPHSRYYGAVAAVFKEKILKLS